MENDERSSSNYLKGKSLYKGIFSRVTLDDELFQLESDVIRKVAKQGDCIIVGWCGNHILQEEETIDVFLYASDLGFRIGRKVEFNGLDRKSAEKQMKILTGTGSVPGIPYGTCTRAHRLRDDYDLSMDTGKIGVETAAELIAVYYQKKTGGREKCLEAKEKEFY